MTKDFLPIAGTFTERRDTDGTTVMEYVADTDCDGTIIIKNGGDLKLSIAANHWADNVKIHIRVKVLALENSVNDLSAVVNIPANITGADSDISFAIIAEPGAKIKMSPNQRISSAPKNARHAASIYRPAPAQILYLESGGITNGMANELLIEAFLSE